jgi:hypothetical protein
MAITSNSDLPTVLNTEEKQIRIAKKLAAGLRGEKAKSARGPRPQGFFSRTIIVTLASGDEVVIQFRPEPLDLSPFLIARKALGKYVPEVGQIEDDELSAHGINVYWMTRIPGQTWFHGIRGKDPRSIITINRSLGRILGAGWLPDQSSAEVVERTLRPHLHLLLSSADPRFQPFEDTAKEFLADLDKLKILPVFIAHFDLNEVNIMIDDTFNVTGLIDWELSTPLPFGMGFSRIHTLAGEFSNKKFYMPAEFEESERGFWEEVYKSLTQDVRDLIDANWDAVQMSIKLGNLLGAFPVENGKLCGVNQAGLEALPKFLTYHIPFIRGTEPPYSK